MTASEQPDYSQAELADISALADGSLDPSRRAAVQSRIDDDPKLRELFEREQRAARILAQARTRDRASAQLRASIEADRQAHHRPRRRVTLAACVGVGVAAAAAMVALIFGGGTPGAPSVSQAAQLALRGSALPAPAPDPASAGNELSASVGAVHFPIYAASLGASAVGARHDLISQRNAVTVYYAHGSRRIAYTIVGGPPLAWPSGRTPAPGFTALEVGHRTVVTWQRGGHTCVLSASGVPLSELVALARFDPPVYRS